MAKEEKRSKVEMSDGGYVVIKRLPMRDGEWEYQIKSLTGRDERVVRESELTLDPLGHKTGRPPAH